MWGEMLVHRMDCENLLGVTLGSGRDKCRLKDIEGTRGPLKGVFKDTSTGGFLSGSSATIGCVRGSRGLYKERTLESSAKTLRSPEVKGELSRFKLENKYRRSRHIYMWRPGARTKQCSW